METQNNNKNDSAQKLKVRLGEHEAESFRRIMETSAILAHLGHAMPTETQRKMSVALHKQLRELASGIVRASGGAVILLHYMLSPIEDAAGNFIYLPPDNRGVLETQSCVIHLQLKNLTSVFNLKENGVDFEAIEESMFTNEDKIVSEANLQFELRRYHDPLTDKPF